MLTIGFTNQYYTLWEVGEPYTEPVMYGTLKVGERVKQDVYYQQNLSMDLEKAKEKLAGREYNINLDLRGKSSFTMTLSSTIKDRENYYPMDCFSFGWYEGSKFSECDNIWQLSRAIDQEKSPRRRVHARRRLIELGDLVRYKHSVNGLKRSYAKESEIPALENKAFRSSLKTGHLFQNGEKVTLKIKELESFSFDGNFGRTYVCVYGTECGKLVKYVGSNPLNISETEFVEVTATVKHDEYKDNLETKLIRIKKIGLPKITILQKQELLGNPDYIVDGFGQTELGGEFEFAVSHNYNVWFDWKSRDDSVDRKELEKALKLELGLTKKKKAA